VVATLLGHSYVGHLCSEEKNMVNQLTKNIVKLGQILLTTKKQDQKNVSTLKIIYNECQKYRHDQRHLKMEIQHLMKLIEHDKYDYLFRQLDNEDVIIDILWAHSNSIKLLNSFPTMLIL